MSVSNRFRDIAKDVAAFRVKLKACGSSADQGARVVKKASRGLQELVDQVGEIPRMRLEFQLTPVLLKVYNNLDQARLIFDDEGLDEQVTATWELQQQIYRLLNDL